MISNLLRRLVKNFSIGVIVLITFLLISFLNFVVVKGQEPSISEKNTSETNTLVRQISFINEEILKDKLSPQMRNSLNEKLVLLQNYAVMIVKGKRSAAIKDENLITISPEVNDPPFQQGIFPGGNHLLTDQAFTSNNYFQTEYQENYYQ
ncbi:MAG: hypothetical protein MUO40_07460, partial [Anaerolineaceae bacterium]|nr:hypothetical protein [Anaerolineaceae bacterium]